MKIVDQDQRIETEDFNSNSAGFTRNVTTDQNTVSDKQRFSILLPKYISSFQEFEEEEKMKQTAELVSPVSTIS